MNSSMRMLASDIMETNLVLARPTELLRNIERRLVDRDVSGVPVVNEAGKLVGVITRSDFVRVPAVLESLDRYIESRMNETGTVEVEVVPDADAPSHSHDGMLDMPASAAMTSPALSCRPTDDVNEVADLMLKHHGHRVVVVNEDETPVGIVSSLDLVRAFMSV